MNYAARGRRERGRPDGRTCGGRLPAAGNGLDVLVEKPIAVNLAEADALLHAAQKNGRILQVGHVERFNPAVVAVEPILNRRCFSKCIDWESLRHAASTWT